MPERKRKRGGTNRSEGSTAPVRPFWSGTITFGLVSIPVDLLAAVRPRQKSMKLVDKKGHPLGRQYHCSKDGKRLSAEEIVRGYETDSGELVVITDEEFESLAPEMSRDIELRRFVPLEQIPPMYYQRPYFLAPAGRSAKAYHLLAQTMERTGRVGIGSFVMRGHEYLTAILAEKGVLRAETLRYADELRTPESIGLPRPAKPRSKAVDRFARVLERQMENQLDLAELEDREAERLQELARAKQKKGRDVIKGSGLEEQEPAEGGAQIIDLMEVLKKSLSKNAVVTNARESTAGAQEDPSSPRRPRRATTTRRTERASANAGDDLDHASKNALYKLASDLDISGRSKMDKSELLEAIRRAG